MYRLPKDPDRVKANVFHNDCPARFLLSKIAGKWSMLVIDALGGAPKRNGELMRKIEGISQKMLTQTLKELEEMQIVVRQDMQTVPPHVEYQLTPLGNDLRERICALDRWVETNMIHLIAGHRSIPLVTLD